MPRSGAFRRHQRRRLIRKRTRILLNVWRPGFQPGDYPWDRIDRPGILDKCNLRYCPCPGCRPPKYDRLTSKAEARRVIREQLDDR
jgi:hypothetical protein